MKKHLILTCMAYFIYGIGFTVQLFGIKAGLGLWPTINIFILSFIFFIIIVFTSFEKVKRKLFDK